jgi:predicted extracellular nuclease
VTRLWRGEDHGYAIMVDDGSSGKHTDRSPLPYAVATGDIIKNIVGPLAYTYGHYKIEPIQPPAVAPIDHTLPEFLPAGPSEFALMTWNAENVFDAKPPNPSDPPLPSPTEYHLALKKMADTIRRAGFPTIVALQEIENIDVLDDLVQEDALKEAAYQPVLIEGTDSRGIDVGYLVRGDAEIVDVKQYDAPEGLTSRPPLVIHVKLHLRGGAVDSVYVINNHFTSMSAGVAITEPRRDAQARWNVHIIQDIILKEDPNAMIAVVGDLNSFLGSKPIQTLRDAGLSHALDILPDDERYDYIFQGESQVLDHILVTSNLFDLLKETRILHVNADFPPPAVEDASAERKSDHDPIIAIFGK